MRTEPRRRSALTLCCWLGLFGAPAGALAQDDSREAALEARIAQLERMVQQLVDGQATATAAPAAAPAAPAGPTIQTTPITPGAGPGTRFSLGGFIKVNTTVSDFSDGNPAAAALIRDFNVPGAIPVGGVGESPVFDLHAKYSRLWFRTDTALENGSTLGTLIEMDFGVPTGGDERVTNRYNPSLRRAFLTYNGWLIGQEWTNFLDLAELPESTDFIGSTEGVVFGRQAQIRYTRGPWAISLENPETTLKPFGGGGRIVPDENTVPDLIAHYTHKAQWGQVAAAGIVRQLRYDTPAGSDSATGYGISLSGKFLFGEDDLRLMATAGSGIGRYVGINFFEDAVLDASGRLDPIDLFAVSAAWRHVWGGSWRSNFILGFSKANNDIALTGLASNAEASSARANLFWSPVPKLDLGFELSTARRALESGASGTVNRADFQAKVSF